MIRVDHDLDTPALVAPAEVSIAHQATGAGLPGQGPGAGRSTRAGVDLDAFLLAEGRMSIDGGDSGEKLGDVGLVELTDLTMHVDLDTVHGMQAIGS